MQEGDIRTLLTWYRLNRRDLPWRHNPTPYRVWVSEIMLQQTQVRTVLPYYERFVAHFPDVASLAAAAESEVLEWWAGMGYYRRARNLHRAAQKIVADFGGRFPGTFDDVVQLPGIGRYTAGAILSIAFNQHHPAVDGNVRRVVTRLTAAQAHLTEREIREQVARWIPRGEASDFNQALMELGAIVCVPVRPRCMGCPIGSGCAAFRRGIQNQIPTPTAGARSEKVALVILVVSRGEDLLLCRQPRGSFIPGEWGLPSRPLARGEKPDESARRFAREVFAVDAPISAKAAVAHGIVHRRITAHVYRFYTNGRPAARGHRWMPAASAAARLTSSLYLKALRTVGGRQ